VGPAGCGKSRVLLPCISEARRRNGDSAVLVMSWTWAAARKIDGQTYHSYLGITPGDSSKERTLEMVKGKRGIRTILDRSRVIVIDEARTFSGRHFIQLEFFLRSLSAAHMEGESWGGHQVVRTFSVDFVLACPTVATLAFLFLFSSCPFDFILT